MADSQSDVERLLAEVERMKREAYDRGWRDAIGAVRKTMRKEINALSRPSAGAASTTVVKREHRGVPSMVVNIIKERPGLRGVEIVEAAQEHGDTNQRTIRTALRRLRKKGKIEQRDGHWFLPGAVAETQEEEAAGTEPTTPAAPSTSNQKEVAMDPP